MDLLKKLESSSVSGRIRKVDSEKKLPCCLEEIAWILLGYTNLIIDYERSIIMTKYFMAGEEQYGIENSKEKQLLEGARVPPNKHLDAYTSRLIHTQICTCIHK